MTSPYHLAPGENPKTYSQVERLSHALKALRAAQTHVRYALPPWHKGGPGLEGMLERLRVGLQLEEQALCAALELAIDAEAKKGRAA